jgi:hypothetical protein
MTTIVSYSAARFDVRGERSLQRSLWAEATNGFEL